MTQLKVKTLIIRAWLTQTLFRNTVLKINEYSWFQTFAVSWMLYAFFWVIPRRLNFIFRRFGILCIFHFHRQVGACRMNLAGDMFGVLYGKRFGSVMAWSIRKEDRVGGWVRVQKRAVKGNDLQSEFYMPTFRNTLFHLHRQVGHYPSQLVSVLWPTPNSVPLLPNGSGHFRAKPFPV